MIKKYNVNDKIGERGWLCGTWVGKDSPFYPDLYTKKLEVAYMKLNSDAVDKCHYHKKADEFLLILKGSLKEEIEGELVELKKDEFVLIKAGSRTELKEVEDGTIELVIKAPSKGRSDKYNC